MKVIRTILLLLAVILLTCVSCDVFRPEENVDEVFDVTKAIKLKPGINRVGELPEGYNFLSLTIYTPNPGEEDSTAGFSLTSVGGNPKSLFSGTSKGIAANPVKDHYTADETLYGSVYEDASFTYLAETENVAFYLEDSIRDIPIDDPNGKINNMAELAAYAIEVLKENIDEVLDIESMMLAGSRHAESNLMDIDGNGKLSVFFVNSEDSDSEGFVYWYEGEYYDLDSFYFNLFGLRTYIESPDLRRTTLESQCYEVFVHEYTHFIHHNVYEGEPESYFTFEGFADSAMLLMHDALPDLVEGHAHLSNLLNGSYHNTPLNHEFTLYAYAIGARFQYFLLQNYWLEKGRDRLEFFALILNCDKLEDVIGEITGKRIQDVYREFILSAFSGMGVRFDKRIKPLAYSKTLGFTPEDLEWALYVKYYFRDILDEGFNPYRSAELPLVENEFPGASFLVTMWNHEENISAFSYERDDPNVETWIFALPIG